MSEKQNARPMRPRMGGPGPMGHMGGGGGEKAKNFKSTMLQLLRYIDEFRPRVYLVMFLAAFSSAFSIAGPKLLGKVTTKLFEGLMAWHLGTGLLTDFAYIRRFIIILVLLYSISAIFSYLQSYIMSEVSMKITYRFRKDISEKMNRLPLKYYDKHTHGDILSRITNDVDTVNQTLNQSLTQIITSIATVLGVLVMMLSISWSMTFVALMTIPLSLVCIMMVVGKSQGYFKTQQKYIGEINGQIEENYSGHNVVQVFNGEADAIRTFRRLNTELFDSAWKSQFLSGLMMPIITFVGNLGYVAVCILGGYLAVKKVIEVGDIQAFIQYVRSFTQPITQLANISNVLQSTAAAAERVFEFLGEEEESPEAGKEEAPETVTGQVEFRNVHFGYSKDKTIINDFSALIRPGQKVAIVGPTGAGKTTIVKLLMRFYDLDSGQILIDGHDTSRLTRNGLRSMFGMVLQDTWLYNGTLRENIRYGSFDKSDQQVLAASRAAHCDEFIRALPHGYDMVINEEVTNISQGQKQLITIARTFLADPRILILDEATSSVDTRTEILIQKAMEKLLEGRTSFVIAHRLSTIKDADLILVMKEGDIVEQGNHETLLARNGFYAELYQSQFSEGEE
jgi:ATP-binding cassette subfamily B protein